MKKSALKEHPLWGEQPMSDEFKSWYEGYYGLKPQKLLVANKKYWKILEKLLVK